jgi:hypothetical protein
MLKKWIFYLSIILVVGFVSSSFKSNKSRLNFSEDTTAFLFYQFPSEQPSDYINNSIPFIGKRFIGFKEAVAQKESQGKYHKINSLGYLGKYQFGSKTLESIGVTDKDEFLKSPAIQEKAFIALLQQHKWSLRKIIREYQGQVIDGVMITESGILAAAHLGGTGSVRKFLKSNGKFKCKDQYGSSVQHYLHIFSGYETHNIKADKYAKVKM